jgi:hypothetical protein
VDNEDTTIDQYREAYGKQVIVFDKLAVAQTFDEAGNFDDRRAVVYARNASFQIAKDLGLDYFLQLDDDYSLFDYRFTKGLAYAQKRILNLDKVFGHLLDFYKSIPAVTIAMGQSGDFIGGKDSTIAKSIKTKRKAMNTFFCATDKPFQFVGRINEDVNTYVSVGNRGGLFLTILQVSITQGTTQSNEGGMTGLYLDSGTYVKSFYTVMFNPSCVTIRKLGHVSPRLHHHIDWRYAVPKIISERHRKPIDATIEIK